MAISKKYKIQWLILAKKKKKNKVRRIKHVSFLFEIKACIFEQPSKYVKRVWMEEISLLYLACPFDFLFGLSIWFTSLIQVLVKWTLSEAYFCYIVSYNFDFRVKVYQESESWQRNRKYIMSFSIQYSFLICRQGCNLLKVKGRSIAPS
jgi:hypothetical protein